MEHESNLMDEFKTCDAEVVATVFTVSVRTVWKKCRNGEWPHMKIGRLYRFSAEDIREITEITRPRRVPAKKPRKRIPV